MDFMKKILGTLLGCILCICCYSQNSTNVNCPYICCSRQNHNSPLPDPTDSLVRLTSRGIIVKFNKGSFAPFHINNLKITIRDDFNYTRMINEDMASNDTTNGFVQSLFLITIDAETKDHTPVKMIPSGGLSLYVPADSMIDDLQKSIFTSFRNEAGVLEWQYEGEPDTLNIDSCSYYVYHVKPASAYHIGKDVGLERNEALLKVKGFSEPKVYVIYKKINVIDFERPDRKGSYHIPNNSDPFNTIVVIKAGRNGKKYFTELRLSEIKEGKNVKEYVVSEKYFIELKNSEIKLRLF
jgi:hypothetical protein